MDFETLGKQYLAESRAVEERARLLRNPPPAPGAESRRLGMLTAMYLELRVVGCELVERGKMYENAAS
ncbi:hypothetical protein [Caproiciproducens sp.]